MKPNRFPRPLSLSVHFALALLLAGCRGGASGEASPGSGATPNPEGSRSHGRVYAYAAFGSADTVSRVVGTLTLQSAVTRFPASLAGTWDLRAVGDAGDVGPQVGTGTFEGEIDSAGKVRINLNPGMADNNVFLVGAFVGGPQTAIAGQWRVSTFVGETAGGRFTATPR